MKAFDIRRIFSLPAVYDFFQNIEGANKAKKKAIETYIPFDRPLRLLEVGCGPGNNVLYLPPHITYVGCDISPEYIAHAEKKFGDRAQFHCVSVEKIKDLNLGKFDVVLLVGVLHHLSDDLVRAFGREIANLLNDGGFFLAIEPCWTPTQSWIDRTIMSWDRGEFIRHAPGYADLLKEFFKSIEVFEMDTSPIIHPTSACVLRANMNKA